MYFLLAGLLLLLDVSGGDHVDGCFVVEVEQPADHVPSDSTELPKIEIAEFPSMGHRQPWTEDFMEIDRPVRLGLQFGIQSMQEFLRLIKKNNFKNEWETIPKLV